MLKLKSNEIDKILEESAIYRNATPEAVRQQLLFDYEEYIMNDVMLAIDGGVISKEQWLSDKCEVIQKEVEICRQVREAQLEATFDSKGKSELQVMVYMIEETQKLINEKFGINALFLSFAKVVRDAVRYKTTFNMIKEISRYVWWTDLSGVYSSENFYSHKKSLTVQELVEYLMRENPNLLVGVGDTSVELLPYAAVGSQFMLRDKSSSKVFLPDNIHDSAKDAVQEVLVIPTEGDEKQERKTTDFALCFSSSKGSQSDVIKWMFKRVQFHLKDKDINIMPSLKEVKNYPSAFAALQEHVDLIDIDGKYSA